MAMVHRICQQCEREYRTHHTVRKKFCSQTCYGLSKRQGQYIPCKHCGEQVWESPSQNRQFCSVSCATTYRNLTDNPMDNPETRAKMSGENNPMYGVRRYGEDNPMYGKTGPDSSRWNGGRHQRKDGYWLIVAPDDHPHPSEVKSSGTKYILEHRLVMEQKIGRYLEPGEVVHHKDEDPSNNDPSNLVLYASQEEHIRDAHS